MLRDKTFLTLVMGGAIVGLVALARPGSPFDLGMPQAQHNAVKLSWKGQFDVVVAGDSRVEAGVDPATMEKELGGLRVANFGFGGCSLSERGYLDAAEQALDPAASCKVIVLAMASTSMRKTARSEFSEAVHERFARFMWMHFGAALDRFETIEGKEAVAMFSARGKRGICRYRHANGWAESYRIPREAAGSRQANPGEARTETFRGVPGDVKAPVLEMVKRWTGKGILVIGFRPPSRQIQNGDAQDSGLERPALIREFEAAGGMWVDVADEGYETLDGLHLDSPAARALSVCLAKTICRLAPGSHSSLPYRDTGGPK